MVDLWPAGSWVKPVVLEARHVQAALAAMRNKTDKNDARGIAQILRTGWYRPVHVKSIESHFGEGCLTGQPRRLATVTAMSDLELMRFDNAPIQRVLHEERTFPSFSFRTCSPATLAWRLIWSISS